MNQNWTMYIWKTDLRCKSGERLVSTTVWSNRDAAGMKRECAELAAMYPASKGFRFDCVEV